MEQGLESHSSKSQVSPPITSMQHAWTFLYCLVLSMLRAQLCQERHQKTQSELSMASA